VAHQPFARAASPASKTCAALAIVVLSVSLIGAQTVTTVKKQPDLLYSAAGHRQCVHAVRCYGTDPNNVMTQLAPIPEMREPELTVAFSSLASGPRWQARLNSSSGVAADGVRNVLVADSK
jgi:hypothetical protein